MKKLPQIPKLKNATQQEGEQKYVYSQEKEHWTIRVNGEHADKIRRIQYHNNFKDRTEVLNYILSKFLDSIDLPPVPKRKDF